MFLLMERERLCGCDYVRRQLGHSAENGRPPLGRFIALSTTATIRQCPTIRQPVLSYLPSTARKSILGPLAHSVTSHAIPSVGVALAVSSGVFIGSSFVVKKKVCFFHSFYDRRYSIRGLTDDVHRASSQAKEILRPVKV